MINQGCHFSSLNFEPKIIAKCLVNDDDEAYMAFKNALALCCTSRVYHHIISSDPFFKEFVKLIDPKHTLFSVDEKTQKEAAQNASENEQTSLKHKCFELRNTFLQKNENFPGVICGEALARKDGVEVISFDEEIVSYMLTENASFQSIEIPENMRVYRRQSERESPCAARSEKFLAINRQCDSAIYIYPPDGKNCLARYEVAGEICQLTIEGDLLRVVEKHLDGSRNLVAFNLELSQQQDPIIIALPKKDKLPPRPICFGEEYLIYMQSLGQGNALPKNDKLPPRPICFGEEYLIYMQSLGQGNQMHALPLSCLHTHAIEGLPLSWIKGDSTVGDRYMLPKGNHFIEVTFKDCYVCDISKASISQEGFLKTEIAKDIVISKEDNAFRTDVYLHNDRIVLAYQNSGKRTKIFSYDLILGKVAELLYTQQVINNCSFKPRFLSVARNIYYLAMRLGETLSEPDQYGMSLCALQIHLITLTYGKI